jgi:hypothetical protein
MTQADVRVDVDMPVEQLVDRLGALYEARDTVKAEIEAVEAELLAVMRYDEARQLLHDRYQVTRDFVGSPVFDVNIVRAELGEVLPPDELNRLIVPEHEEVKTVAARVDGRVALQLRKLGRQVSDALDKAMLPRAEKLVVKLKEANGASK